MVVPDAALVAGLLRLQCPWLAAQDVRPTASSGSSNAVFRLGDSLAVRLPLSDAYAIDLAKETRWLPYLGPQLPVPVPEVVFEGTPSAEFPRPWAVVTWLPGDNPTSLDAAQQATLAHHLGEFVRALHGIDTRGERPGADRWGYRCGEPVTPDLDRGVAHAAERLGDLFDPGQVRRAWGILRRVPVASGAPCWVHTDLSAENILVSPSGDLAGVIDFGGLGVGDPAVDLLYAWGLVDAPARAILRTASGADEATWARARAWGFVGPGLVSLANYRTTMPERAVRLTTMVEAIAHDVGVALR